MAETLTPTSACFDSFYRWIHGTEQSPWKWQTRAAIELAQRTAWTQSAGEQRRASLWSALSAPTGSGKTTLVECFLFALACTAREQPRPLPLRLFWVVDRRNVVDQVYEHAAHVVERIAAAERGIPRAIRDRLDELAGAKTSMPVEVRLWRGGLGGLDTTAGLTLQANQYQRPGSAKVERGIQQRAPEVRGPRDPLSPCTPAIICSTVDQIGSRMLFRGYGSSRASRPIDAALTAVDSLVVLDEAHLSQPFLETARAIAKSQTKHDVPLPPVQILPISATHHATFDDTFELTNEERAEPMLAKRLRVSKLMHLEKGRGHVALSVKHATRLAGNDGVDVVGVVANLVADARAIATRLKEHGEVVLVIGPVRPLDRAVILSRIPKRSMRSGMSAPLFVVGTQTLEVGLDVDFDALVTACAPFSALVQRLGRLDRAGDRGTSLGVIVAPPKDSIYGEASAITWNWLLERAEGDTVDLGPDRIAQLADPPPPPDLPRAPLLGPWHLEAFATTSHDPVPDPSVAIFLRGERALDQPDVQVCWRADLLPEAEDWVERVRQRLPHPGELLSVSLPAVRRWLAGIRDADVIADVDVTYDMEDRSTPEPHADPLDHVVRLPPAGKGGEVKPEIVRRQAIRPGDVIAVPAWYGGCDESGWAPKSSPVTDLGNLNPTRPRVLLSSALGLAGDMLDRMESIREQLASEALDPVGAYAELLEIAQTWLTSTTDSTATQIAAQGVANELQRRSTGTAGQPAQVVPIGEDLLLVPPTQTRRTGHAGDYNKHVTAVVERTELFVQRLGLPKSVSTALVLAAHNHDLGKLDRRFQAWLNGGTTNDGPLLAKSGHDPNDRAAQRARDVAGWPVGKRHEGISAALVDAALSHIVAACMLGIDQDLLLHLICAHHGDGRPFRNGAWDVNPVDVNADVVTGLDPPTSVELTVRSDIEIPWGEHAERFTRLTERYGPWGLAALESVLVLADRSVSAEEAA